MKIDFLAVGCLEEAEFAGWIEPRDGCDRRPVMMLHLPLRAARLILQLPAGALERVVDGKIQICAPFIRRRRVFDIDLAPVGKRKRMWMS